MRVKFSKYEPDNSVIGGFGGVLMDPVMARTAHRLARQVEVLIHASALAAEARAAANDIEPGHVSKTFAETHRRGAIDYYKTKTGHVNPRRTAEVYVTGKYEPGDRDSEGYAVNLRSSPATLEFGSRYKEGARRRRPALRVMRNALEKWVAGTPGTRIAGKRGGF